MKHQVTLGIKIGYSVIAWIVCGAAFISHFILMALTSIFVKDRVDYNVRTARWFLSTGMRLLGIQLTVHGHEHIPETGPFIIIANHQSHMDIASFLIATRRTYSFVAKKELLAVPLLGWELRNQGHIAIDRSKPTQAKAQLDALIEDISNGRRNLLVFAEGTRSATGRLGKFKLGAFDLAAKTGATVIPAVITGSYNVLNKNSFLMSPGRITIHFTSGIIIPPEASGTTGGLDPYRRTVVSRIQSLLT